MALHDAWCVAQGPQTVTTTAVGALVGPVVLTLERSCVKVGG